MAKVWHFGLPYDDDWIVDATAGVVEGVSDTETDDDATTQDNRRICSNSSLLAVFVTSRRADGQLRMQSLGHNQLPHRLGRSRHFAQFVWRLSVTVP